MHHLEMVIYENLIIYFIFILFYQAETPCTQFMPFCLLKVLILLLFLSVHSFNTISMRYSLKKIYTLKASCMSTTMHNVIESNKKRILFLGTPTFAAESLQTLYDTSCAPSCQFTIAGVVTQPISGTQKKASPVQLLAKKLQLPLLAPVTAKDPEFIEQLEKLNIDLCITAAYGNYLPRKFLSIPKYGTVNIHPSLLPKYRGAAPVQRSLENGDMATGVSVAYTVLKMDAGPIIKQIPYPLTGNEKAPQVLTDCFRLGTAALIDALPGIFDGTASQVPQCEEDKSEAPKLSMSESAVDFAKLTAAQVHNKCRGFTPWPGILSYFTVGDSANPPTALKIITTIILDNQPNTAACTNEVSVIKHPYEGKDAHMLRVVCSDGSILGIVEVLPPHRKAMFVRDFLNGLKGNKSIKWSSPIVSSCS